MYDAFISYSHARDKPIAGALQRVIQSLGKSWWQRRSLRVFRDDTSLSATPELWPSIEKALAASNYLVLLISPEAAASKWVAREAEWWLANKDAKTILIALTAGDLTWDGKLKLPGPAGAPLEAVLRGAFATEPLWIDLRQFSAAPEKAHKRDPDFVSRVASLAATIRGIAKEDLISEELRQQRRALTLAWSAAAIVAVLAAVSVWAAGERQTALNEARLNLASAFIGRASLSRSEREGHKALVYLAEAARTTGTESWPTRSLLIGAPVVRRAAIFQASERVRDIVFLAQNNRMAVLTGNKVELVDLERKAANIALPPPEEGQGISNLHVDKTGRLLLARSDKRLIAWDIGGTSSSSPAVVYDGKDQTGSTVQSGLALSSDGDAIYFPVSDDLIVRLDGQSFEPVGRIKRYGFYVEALSVHPGGAFLAEQIGNSDDVLIRATNGSADSKVSRLEPPDSEGECGLGSEDVAFSPDGRFLAAAIGAKVVRVWNVNLFGDRIETTLRFDAEVGNAVVEGIAISPDAKLLAAAASDYSVAIWDLTSRRLLARYSAHRGKIYSIAFTPDSRALATGSEDGTVELWRITRENDHGVRIDLGSSVGGRTGSCGITFSPDGSQIALPATKGSIWAHATEDIGPDAIRQMRVAEMLGLGTGGILNMEEKRPARVYDFDTQSFIDMEPVPLKSDVKPFPESANPNAWNPDTAGTGETPKLLFLDHHKFDASCFAFVMNGSRLLGLDRSWNLAAMWEMPSGKYAGQFAIQGAWPVGIGVHAGSSRVAFLLDNGEIEIGEISRNPYKPLKRLSAPLQGERMIDLNSRLHFSRTGDQLLVEAYQTEFRLWDVNTGASKVLSSGTKDAADEMLGVAGDAEFAIRQMGNGYVAVVPAKIAGAVTETVLQKIDARGRAARVATSSRGLIAVPNSDGSLNIWDARTQRLHTTFKRDVGRLIPMTFDGAGTILLAQVLLGNEPFDQPLDVIEFWDARSGRLIGSLDAEGASGVVMSTGHPRMALVGNRKLVVKGGVDDVELASAEASSGYAMQSGTLARLGPSDPRELALTKTPFVIDRPIAAFWPVLFKFKRELATAKDYKTPAAPLRTWLEANSSHPFRTTVPTLVESMLPEARGNNDPSAGPLSSGGLSLP